MHNPSIVRSLLPRQGNSAVRGRTGVLLDSLSAELDAAGASLRQERAARLAAEQCAAAAKEEASAAVRRPPLWGALNSDKQSGASNLART